MFSKYIYKKYYSIKKASFRGFNILFYLESCVERKYFRVGKIFTYVVIPL